MDKIFFTGAPGSRWSSVISHIYWSEDIDQSDYNSSRLYHKFDKNKGFRLSHIGAYWDPGMEFNPFSAAHWAAPFSGNGIKIIKSHVFSYCLDWLVTFKCPIVMVYRNDFECFTWWKKAGGFDITYPNYLPYYKNDDNMWREIQAQNSSLLKFIKKNQLNIDRVYSNNQLCNLLKLNTKNIEKLQDYQKDDIQVYVYNVKVSNES